jgi:hypothetical protein
MKFDYKKGGFVKPAGNWLKILNVLPHRRFPKAQLEIEGGVGWIWSEQLEILFPDMSYRSPCASPYSWLKPGEGGLAVDSLNKVLDARWGDPTEHAYRGEPASDFGLSEKETVLYREPGFELYAACLYCDLDIDDIWRRTPKPPKETYEIESNDR